MLHCITFGFAICTLQVSTFFVLRSALQPEFVFSAKSDDLASLVMRVW